MHSCPSWVTSCTSSTPGERRPAGCAPAVLGSHCPYPLFVPRRERAGDAHYFALPAPPPPSGYFSVHALPTSSTCRTLLTLQRQMTGGRSVIQTATAPPLPFPDPSHCSSPDMLAIPCSSIHPMSYTLLSLLALPSATSLACVLQIARMAPPHCPSLVPHRTPSSPRLPSTQQV